VIDITLLTPQENGSSSNGNGRWAKQGAKGHGSGEDNTSPDYGDVGITDSDIPF